VEDKTVERQNMPRIKNVKKRFASINKRAQWWNCGCMPLYLPLKSLSED